jgi:hypothetical protein
MGGGSNAPSTMGGGSNAPSTMGGGSTGPAAMGSSGAAPAGGMMGEMAKMMPPPPSGACSGGDCETGTASKNPIYPSMMTLAALTPEKRAEIDALATQQINQGMTRLAKASESLNRATQAGDNTGMQQSIGAMRTGLDELGAGVAARRVLSEGKAPRNLALDWFKREMNLASPIQRDEPRGWFGVTPFHLFTMVLLVSFALAMLAMYFFKMRRAAALFGRLEGGPGKAPPGSSPPLVGTPGPAVPAPASNKTAVPDKSAAAVPAAGAPPTASAPAPPLPAEASPTVGASTSPVAPTTATAPAATSSPALTASASPTAPPTSPPNARVEKS